jgi:RHH-type proline utilization regulon transcriptional repressor/proline dehydrogenase/delta 1-pyrroline-5-carboxylate dehydrogenase
VPARHGRTLYDQVVGADNLGKACRIYAPVGSHETLLAYLVRRLLENGANSSFVNQIVDESVPIDTLLADPFEAGARRQVRPAAPAHSAAADLLRRRARIPPASTWPTKTCCAALGRNCGPAPLPGRAAGRGPANSAPPATST